MGKSEWTKSKNPSEARSELRWGFAFVCALVGAQPLLSAKHLRLSTIGEADAATALAPDERGDESGFADEYNVSSITTLRATADLPNGKPFAANCETIRFIEKPNCLMKVMRSSSAGKR